MAKSTIGIGIELAGDELRLAVVESGADGPVLTQTQTIPVGTDLARGVRGLPRRPAGVVCAVPLENAAVRILSLPPTSDENVERVIGMEAESVLPIPTEEL